MRNTGEGERYGERRRVRILGTEIDVDKYS
jgi:hypothetical protein